MSKFSHPQNKEPIGKELAIRRLIECMRSMEEEQIEECRKRGYSDEQLKEMGLLEEKEVKLAELVKMSKGKSVAIGVYLTDGRINKMFEATVCDLRDLNIPVNRTGCKGYIGNDLPIETILPMFILKDGRRLDRALKYLVFGGFGIESIGIIDNNKVTAYEEVSWEYDEGTENAFLGIFERRRRLDSFYKGVLCL